MKPSEILAAEELYTVGREGRFLVVELLKPHRVLCTSAHGGGQRDDLRYLVNHQSCEGRGHRERLRRLKRLGEADYHRETCAEMGLDPEGGRAGDIPRACIFVTTTCLIFAGATALAIWRLCT